MSQTENGNQGSLPVAGEHGSTYMQSIKSLSAFRIKSNIRYADELQYISQISAINVCDYFKHFNLK